MRNLITILLVFIALSMFGQENWVLPKDTLNNLSFKDCMFDRHCDLKFKPHKNANCIGAIYERCSGPHKIVRY